MTGPHDWIYTTSRDMTFSARSHPEVREILDHV
jgi:hypothetical protein